MAYSTTLDELPQFVLGYFYGLKHLSCAKLVRNRIGCQPISNTNYTADSWSVILQSRKKKLFWGSSQCSETPGGWFNIKMPSYQYRKSHCGEKTIVRSSYLHNGISYTGRMASLYWIGALCLFCACEWRYYMYIISHWFNPSLAQSRLKCEAVFILWEFPLWREWIEISQLSLCNGKTHRPTMASVQLVFVGAELFLFFKLPVVV